MSSLARASTSTPTPRRAPRWVARASAVAVAVVGATGAAHEAHAQAEDAAPVRCVSSGEFTQGRDDGPRRDERPAHRVFVRAFCMDRTLVTRAAFARFVDETRYQTDAERRGYGIEAVEGMRDWAWRRVVGGSFRRPFRDEDEDTRGFLRDDAPAVMVSWNDAVAFCRARGGRLPTEAEWEYAMRAGSSGTRYPWGASARDASGRLRLNYWQGRSHEHNDRRDGYVYVSPVRAFEPNAWGFYDPVGNVWQWTADVYRADAYASADAQGRALDEAQRPEGALATPRQPMRVLRGGSWWCAQCTCQAYGLYYRGHAAPNASFSNNGFRCAYDAPPSAAR